MTIVSQKTDARNELAGAGFVRAPNVGIVKDATGRVLAPISVTPEAFTTDIADIQGQFPIVWNTERMPYASAVHNTQYYYDNTVVGGAITTTVTTLPIGKGVVSEEGGYVLLDISKDATPLSENIYTDDGTITDPLRTVSFDDVNNTIRFDLDSSNGALVEAYNSYSPIEILYPWGNRAFIEFGTPFPFPNEHKSYVGDASGDDSPYTGLRLECLGGQAGDNNVILNSTFGNYILETAPTANNNASNVLVLGTDNRIQTRNINTISTARYANTWTPTANVETVHTHALSAGEDIQIQVRDATTKEIVNVEIRIISATTFGVTSTTTADLRVIAL